MTTSYASQRAWQAWWSQIDHQPCQPTRLARLRSCRRELRLGRRMAYSQGTNRAQSLGTTAGSRNSIHLPLSHSNVLVRIDFAHIHGPICGTLHNVGMLIATPHWVASPVHLLPFRA